MRGRFHPPWTLETWEQDGQLVCPRLGRRSHREIKMRGVYRWVSNQVRDSGEYVLDHQSGQDKMS